MSEVPCRFAKEGRTNNGDPLYYCNLSQSHWGVTKCTGLGYNKKNCPFWAGAFK